jgi:hypothetical protein
MAAAADGALQGNPASRKDCEMNDDVGGNRGRSWRDGLRRAAMPAAVAGTALLTTACGGGSSPAVAGSTAYQKGLAFAQCMRSHGLPNMPDPVVNANGVAMHIPAGVSPGSAQLKAAQQACRSLMPGLGGRS